MLSWAKHAILKPPSEEEQALMEPEELLTVYRNYHEAIKKADSDPYRYGIVLDNWKRMPELLGKCNDLLVLGGNRCLAGEQTIYDPVQNRKLRVDEITEPFHVYAWDENEGKRVVARAEVPFTKPKGTLFTVVLSNDDKVICTSKHRFLTKDGWLDLGQIMRLGHHTKLRGKDSWVEIDAVVAKRYDTVWDFTVPVYENYFAGGVVNHNSAKTSGGAWLVVRCAMENSNSLIVCFSQNAELSVLVQQSAIYKALPSELKSKTLGANEYVSYTTQNGFAGNSFILPNGSRILFKTYSQFTQNQTVLEGLELGCYDPKTTNLGAWCDEYLGGPELINTLSFRLATRDSKLLLTFTPIDGYTETIRQYLDNAITEETKVAEALRGIAVPYIQRSTKKNAFVLYMHTKDNPFSGYERVLEEAKAKNDDDWIKTRLYGIPTKSATTLFPRFNTALNVIAHEKIPTKGVTRYMVIDPAGKKNWFICWIAVDATETWYVYREWPDINVGEWGTWRGTKWGAGEGAKSLGYGIRDYVDLINRMEIGENIYERLIDPRLGQAKYSHEWGQSSIIEDLADAGIVCVPAPGLDEADGLTALQTKMAYNQNAPIDGINRPHFYISDRCQNIIWALQEYTGAGGPDEQAKDPIDVIRYAAVASIYYCDEKLMKAAKPKQGGY